MANPQLLAYIREHTQQFTKGQLVQALASAGWAAADISEAFKELEQPAPPAQPAVVPAQPAQVMPPPIVAEQVKTTAPVTPTIPITPIIPTIPQQAALSSNPGDFVAQMEKRRREAVSAQPMQAAAANPLSVVSVARTPAATTEKGIIGMLIKMKLAKNEQQANVIMIGIIIVCLGCAAWFIF